MAASKSANAQGGNVAQKPGPMKNQARLTAVVNRRPTTRPAKDTSPKRGK